MSLISLSAASRRRGPLRCAENRARDWSATFAARAILESSLCPQDSAAQSATAEKLNVVQDPRLTDVTARRAYSAREPGTRVAAVALKQAGSAVGAGKVDALGHPAGTLPTALLSSNIFLDSFHSFSPPTSFLLFPHLFSHLGPLGLAPPLTFLFCSPP